MVRLEFIPIAPILCQNIIMETNEEKNKKKPKIDITKMGVDIDKNEYKEIILSQSNHPDKSFYDKYR